jgi:hypothetical protein
MATLPTTRVLELKRQGEGREGIAAFIEKWRPTWADTA